MRSIADEKLIFNEFLKGKNLKHSEQRDQILDVFLQTEKHVTVEELHKLVKGRYSNIGLVTVYRTLKLLVEAGLSDELFFEDGIARYEHKYNHKHHDHLLCTRCGEVVEVIEPEIEKLQDKLFNKYGYAPETHNLELYGICPKCRRK